MIHPVHAFLWNDNIMQKILPNVHHIDFIYVKEIPIGPQKIHDYFAQEKCICI